MNQIFNVFVIIAFVSSEETCEKNRNVQSCSKIADEDGKYIQLSENVLMPQIGFGTWKIVGDETIHNVNFSLNRDISI